MRCGSPAGSIRPAMRGPRILTRYLTREVIQYTLLGLAAISVILLARNLVRVLDELLGAGFSWTDLALLVRVLGTMLLLYALPVSFLFGVLLAVGRMAADVEIVAMRACGIGLRHLLLPVLALGLAISGLTLNLALDVEPAARRELRGAVASLVARGAGIEPGRFRRFGDVLVYIDARGGDRLQGIVVSDRRDPERPLIVFARQGRMAVDESGSQLELALEDGDIHLDHGAGQDERDVRISFERFDYTLDLEGLLGGSPYMRAKEMSWKKLRLLVAKLERYPRQDAWLEEPSSGRLREAPIAYALDLHRRVAGPVAPALFGLVGLPIGMRRTRGARAWGALWCAGLAFSYYALQTFFSFLAETGWLGAGVAMWMPNVCFAALAIALLLRARGASAAEPRVRLATRSTRGARLVCDAEFADALFALGLDEAGALAQRLAAASGARGARRDGAARAARRRAAAAAPAAPRRFLRPALGRPLARVAAPAARIACERGAARARRAGAAPAAGGGHAPRPVLVRGLRHAARAGHPRWPGAARRRTGGARVRRGSARCRAGGAPLPRRRRAPRRSPPRQPAVPRARRRLRGAGDRPRQGARRRLPRCAPAHARADAALPLAVQARRAGAAARTWLRPLPARLLRRRPRAARRAARAAAARATAAEATRGTLGGVTASVDRTRE